MTAERLLEKIELREERDWEQKREERKRQATQPKPVNRAEANINRVVQLRKKTYDIDRELATQRMLAVEEKRNREARVALHRSNMTPAEKQEQDELM